MQWNDVIVCHGLAISDSNYLLLTSQQEHIKSWIQEVPSFGSFHSHSNDIWGKNLRAPVHTQSNICQTRIHAKITTTIHINIYTKYDWSHRLERLRTRDRASRRMRKKTHITNLLHRQGKFCYPLHCRVFDCHAFVLCIGDYVFVSPEISILAYITITIDAWHLFVFRCLALVAQSRQIDEHIFIELFFACVFFCINW